MPSQGPSTCPVCGVKIIPAIGGDRVIFSAGPPGTRQTLWAKVCRYTEKAGCINQKAKPVSDTNPMDFRST